MLRSELIAAGPGADVEGLHTYLFELLRAQPGYQGGALLNSLGQPQKYTRITVWEHRDAVRTFWRSEAVRRFAQQYPTASIFTATRPIEAYAIVHRRSEPGQPGHAPLVDWTVEQGQAAQFEASRTNLIELRHRLGHGAVTTALSCYLGSPNRYFSYLSSASEDDLQAFVASAEYQQWVGQHFQAYSSAAPAIEALDVVYAQVLATA